MFIIAEAGVNHNGDVRLGMKLVDAAADAGADAVKFQSFKAEAVASASAPKAAYQLETTDRRQSQLEMLRALELPAEAHRELQRHAGERGLLFLSTPFDRGSVDLLDEMGVPAFKIGSGEVTNLPLLDHIAGKGRPIILSTGMCYLSEVAQAVDTIGGHGCELALLHCVTNYPAAPSDANLRAMKTMEDAFSVPVGYSDHTQGNEVALAAVALGACIVEKHLTLDRTLPGPDHKASLEPDELRTMVRAIRTVESALGTGEKVPTEAESETRERARRSLVTATEIARGTVVTQSMLTLLRPGNGIAPSEMDQVIGKRAIRDLPDGHLLTWGDLS